MSGISKSFFGNRRWQRLFTALFALLTFLLFASCSNLFDNDDTEKSDTTYVTVTGSLKLSGAFPKELVCPAVESEAASRTAFPSLPTLIGSSYIVKAVGTDTVNPAADVNATVTIATDGTVNYTLSIPTPETTKKFKITASAVYDSKEILSGASAEFSINTEDTVKNIDVNVSANQASGGTGKTGLEIQIESGSGITKCKIDIDDTPDASNKTVSSDKITLNLTGLSSGVHTMVFNFTDNASKVLYSFTETINIFDNLTTNTWIQNGNEPWFTTTVSGGSKVTSCQVTKAMVEGFALTEIWVQSGATGTQSGTFFNPKASLTSALNSLNDPTKDYTIYIKGTLIGHYTIPVSLINTDVPGSAYTYAHSLTICGYTGLDENGMPQDTLNGNGMGPVLSIFTDVPVTIKNLKITNGSTTSNGGGIYISGTNSKVYLTDGAVITGNQAACGGGVFVDNGSLFVYGSAVVGKSGVSTHAGTTSGSYGNKATTSGGGIGVGTGTLWLGYCGENIPAETSGGVIYNLVIGAAETHGGGIDNQSGTVNIARGNVSYNYACCSSGSTATGCGGGISTARIVNLTGTAVIEKNYSSYGGGVYITRDTYNGHLVMTGGTIQLNHANKEHPGTGESWGDGGGVAIGSNASFTISGGTISTNYAERCGGAVVDHFGTAFNVKGSAYIPYDSVHSCNDVYIESTKRIALSESLTPPAACTDGIIAKITPSAYTEGTPVLTITAPATSAEVSHFKIMPNGAQEWGITTQGKLKEGVVLPSSSSAMVSGNTYLVSDSSAINKIAEFSSSGYSFNGVKLKLDSNVTVSTAWTPIGNGTAFSGTFDGNEKTVTFDSGAAAEAFFGTVNGTVKNLKVAGSTSVAGIAKKANTSAVIENCESSATVTGNISQEYVAGIVAEVYGATIKGCVNNGTVISNYVANSTEGINQKGAGGITGPVKNGGVVDSCVNTGSVTGLGAGGISSHISYTCTIRNSQNSGDITSTRRYAGGIAAGASGNGNDLSQAAHIDNCFNSGSVTASGTTETVYAGGIVGALGWGSTAWAQNCLNIGNVSLSPSAASGSKAGALFGSKDTYAKIDFCYYKEGCAGTSFGNGGSTSDTANQCIKAAQSGSNNAVISDGVTLNETTYSAGTSTVLSLLNAWVSANSTGGLYLVWEADTNHWPKLKNE